MSRTTGLAGTGLKTFALHALVALLSAFSGWIAWVLVATIEGGGETVAVVGLTTAWVAITLLVAAIVARARLWPILPMVAGVVGFITTPTLLLIIAISLVGWEGGD